MTPSSVSRALPRAYWNLTPLSGYLATFFRNWVDKTVPVSGSIAVTVSPIEISGSLPRSKMHQW